MHNHIKRTITRLGAALLIALIALPATSVPIDPLPEPSFTPSKPKPKPKPKQDRKQEPKPKRKQDRKQKAERMSKQDPNPNPGSRKLDRERRPEDKAESPRSRLKDEPDKKPGHESSKYYGHTDYRHLDLITRYKKDGPYRYFTVSEWNAVPSTAKSRYDKLGVVVVSEKCAPFYIELYESGREMDWYEANRVYGNHLPSVDQCKAIGDNYLDINFFIKSFGGICSDDWCWGQLLSPSSIGAVMVTMKTGAVHYDEKKNKHGVRAVAPVPIARSM